MLPTRWMPTGTGSSSCSVLPQTAGCIFPNDYTWTVADTNVATVSDFGYVVARNPGVTNVYANAERNQSAPLAFVTCPPSSIVLTSSAVTQWRVAAGFVKLPLHDGRSGSEQGRPGVFDGDHVGHQQ